jgi:hypothetical protein
VDDTTDAQTPWPADDGDTAGREPGGQAVTYVFPVEVVVLGALGEDDLRTIEGRIWSSLGMALSQSV